MFEVSSLDSFPTLGLCVCPCENHDHASLWIREISTLCAMNFQEMLLVFVILFIINVFLFKFQKGKYVSKHLIIDRQHMVHDRKMTCNTIG